MIFVEILNIFITIVNKVFSHFTLKNALHWTIVHGDRSPSCRSFLLQIYSHSTFLKSQVINVISLFVLTSLQTNREQLISELNIC